jgi:hypothetical protein
MTRDVSRWDKAARDQRSTEMNPNNPQYYASRHISPDEERGAGILAMSGFCGKHFGSDEKERNAAYLWDGKQWVPNPIPMFFDEYNYIIFCQKCGYVQSRNFSWTQLGLTDSDYSSLLDSLSTKLELELWGEQ